MRRFAIGSRLAPASVELQRCCGADGHRGQPVASSGCLGRDTTDYVPNDCPGLTRWNPRSAVRLDGEREDALRRRGRGGAVPPEVDHHLRAVGERAVRQRAPPARHDERERLRAVLAAAPVLRCKAQAHGGVLEDPLSVG